MVSQRSCQSRCDGGIVSCTIVFGESMALSLEKWADMLLLRDVRQRKYEEAELLFRRALSLAEGSFRGGHPMVSSNLTNLVDIVFEQVRKGIPRKDCRSGNESGPDRRPLTSCGVSWHGIRGRVIASSCAMTLIEAVLRTGHVPYGLCNEVPRVSRCKNECVCSRAARQRYGSRVWAAVLSIFHDMARFTL